MIKSNSYTVYIIARSLATEPASAKMVQLESVPIFAVRRRQLQDANIPARTHVMLPTHARRISLVSRRYS